MTFLIQILWTKDFAQEAEYVSCHRMNVNLTSHSNLYLTAWGPQHTQWYKKDQFLSSLMMRAMFQQISSRQITPMGIQSLLPSFKASWCYVPIRLDPQTMCVIWYRCPLAKLQRADAWTRIVVTFFRKLQVHSLRQMLSKCAVWSASCLALTCFHSHSTLALCGLPSQSRQISLAPHLLLSSKFPAPGRPPFLQSASQSLNSMTSYVVFKALEH